MIKRWLIIILVAAGSLLLPAVSRGQQTTPPIAELAFGTSTEGRAITGTRIGTGPHKLFIVANTHGGPEANTYALALALQAYFRANPAAVPPPVSLYIIPTVNPDGLSINTRFNSRSVDLNRNMDTNFDACPENDWNHTVEGAYGYVSDTGGPFVESEVESQVVRDLVLDAAGVVWLHSSGGDVFPAFCEHAPSIALAQTYAQASGYRYDRFWGQYNITGGMHDWAGALGIASITPELASGSEPEVEQNLAAVLAILADYERLLPIQSSIIEPTSGIEMPTLLWRYWRAHGGPDWFGAPISPVVVVNGRPTLYFATQHLILNPEGADALQPVLRVEGGLALWTQHLLDAPTATYQLR